MNHHRFTAEELDRLPPHCAQSEMATNGSLLQDPTLTDEVGLIVRADAFYVAANRIIFGHLVAMHAEGHRVDVLLLVDRLRAAGQLDSVGGMAYLTEVAASVPTAANAVHYAKIVRDKAVLRNLRHAAIEILRDASDERADVQEVFTSAERLIQNAADFSNERDAVPMSIAGNDALAALDRRKTAPAGLATGFVDLDRKTGGFRAGEFTVLAARPGVGKSALATTVCDNVAVRLGRQVLFVTLEMTRTEIVNRIFAQRAQVNADLIRDGKLNPGERLALIEANAAISSAPLWFVDAPALSLSEIASLARRHQRQHGLDLLTIDYLGLVVSDNPRDPRQEQVARTARRLKGLARELQIPVLCLCQLNREVERAGDHRPRLSHLRESGAIEQDADVVLLLHRPEMYSDDPDLVGKAELDVAKNRCGPTGTVPLTWIPEFAEYRSAPTMAQATDWRAAVDADFT